MLDFIDDDTRPRHKDMEKEARCVCVDFLLHCRKVRTIWV